MVKRILCPFVIFVLALAGAVPARAEIGVTIRYYDTKIYYLNTDPIWVQVTLTNSGPGPFRFKLADERMFSLDFDVRTTTNRPVEMADLLLRRRTQSQQVYFREVSIEAGESFSFIEDLRHYAFIDRTGAYVVQARIYPELYRPELHAQDLTRVGAAPVYINPNTASAIAAPATASASALADAQFSGSAPLSSNRLSLTIRYPLILGPDGVPVPTDEETNATLARAKMPPDEVVSYLIEARQKEQWEKFFLYLDLEAMIARNSSRYRQWQAESEEGRRRMLDRYRVDLQSAVIDGDISTIPMDFIIERTMYNADEGTVTVLEHFRTGMYTERKRFTYYLRRRDNIWSVVDYSVVNLGTE